MTDKEMKTHQEYGIPTDAFGLCPNCKSQPIMFAIGKNDYCRCDRCKVFWPFGRGNLGPCFDEEENEARRRILMTYKQVKPMRWGTDDNHFYMDRKNVLKQKKKDNDTDLPF